MLNGCAGKELLLSPSLEMRLSLATTLLTDNRGLRKELCSSFWWKPMLKHIVAKSKGRVALGMRLKRATASLWLQPTHRLTWKVHFKLSPDLAKEGSLQCVSNNSAAFHQPFSLKNLLYAVLCLSRMHSYVSFDQTATMWYVCSCSDSLLTSPPKRWEALTNLTLLWNVYLKSSLLPQKAAHHHKHHISPLKRCLAFDRFLWNVYEKAELDSSTVR